MRAAFAEIFERFPEFGFETYRVLYGEDFWVLDWALTFTPEGAESTARFDCLDVVNVSPEALSPARTPSSTWSSCRPRCPTWTSRPSWRIRR